MAKAIVNISNTMFILDTNKAAAILDLIGDAEIIDEYTNDPFSGKSNEYLFSIRLGGDKLLEEAYSAKALNISIAEFRRNS